MKHSNVTLYIPQATAQGYIECPVWGCFDWNYPTSKLRRGRVQEGGRVSPAICVVGHELLVILPYDNE